MDMSTAALLVVLFQYLVFIYNLPALDGSQSKQLVCREKVHESRDAMCRQDCQWAHCLHLLCALDWETVSDAQTPALTVILDNRTSVALAAYL